MIILIEIIFLALVCSNTHAFIATSLNSGKIVKENNFLLHNLHHEIHIFHKKICLTNVQQTTIFSSSSNVGDSGFDVDKVIELGNVKMKKSVESVFGKFGSIRTNRPSANLFDRLVMKINNIDIPLIRFCTVTVSGVSELTVKPFEIEHLKPELINILKNRRLSLTFTF